MFVPVVPEGIELDQWSQHITAGFYFNPVHPGTAAQCGNGIDGAVHFRLELFTGSRIKEDQFACFCVFNDDR